MTAVLIHYDRFRIRTITNTAEKMVGKFKVRPIAGHELM